MNYTSTTGGANWLAWTVSTKPIVKVTYSPEDYATYTKYLLSKREPTLPPATKEDCM